MFCARVRPCEGAAQRASSMHTVLCACALICALARSFNLWVQLIATRRTSACVRAQLLPHPTSLY